MPLEVYGIDLSGQDFIEKARTKAINRCGASVVIGRSLGPEDILAIKRPGSSTEAKARIVGQIGIEQDGNVYGIELCDVEKIGDFWGIYFPPLESSSDSLVRVLLECAACKSREVAPLNEIEFAVFEANDRLRRQCKNCREQTYWKQPLFEAEPSEAAPPARAPRPDGGPREVELEPAPESAEEQPQTAKKDENRRRSARVKVKLRACVLLTKPDENEIVEVLDISRTGIRFRSSNKYQDNMWVQVAVPYTQGTGNIFQPGRIVWRKELPGRKFEHGLKYVKF